MSVFPSLEHFNTVERYTSHHKWVSWEHVHQRTIREAIKDLKHHRPWPAEQQCPVVPIYPLLRGRSWAPSSAEGTVSTCSGSDLLRKKDKIGIQNKLKTLKPLARPSVPNWCLAAEELAPSELSAAQIFLAWAHHCPPTLPCSEQHVAAGPTLPELGRRSTDLTCCPQVWREKQKPKSAMGRPERTERQNGAGSRRREKDELGVRAAELLCNRHQPWPPGTAARTKPRNTETQSLRLTVSTYLTKEAQAWAQCCQLQLQWAQHPTQGWGCRAAVPLSRRIYEHCDPQGCAQRTSTPAHPAHPAHSSATEDAQQMKTSPFLLRCKTHKTPPSPSKISESSGRTILCLLCCFFFSFFLYVW